MRRSDHCIRYCANLAYFDRVDLRNLHHDPPFTPDTFLVTAIEYPFTVRLNMNFHDVSNVRRIKQPREPGSTGPFQKGRTVMSYAALCQPALAALRLGWK